MARAGLLIAAGALAVLATTTTIGLEIASCVNAADKSSLIGACGVAATVESIALIMLGALGTIQLVQNRIPSSWSRSRLSFVVQLLVCIAAAATSIVALAVLQQSTSDQYNDTLIDMRRNLLIGLAIALAVAAIFQVAFVCIYFLTHRDPAPESSLSSSFHSGEDQRNMHVKGIRYSRTAPVIMKQEQETMMKGQDTSVVIRQATNMSPIGYLRASVTQAIRPTHSKTKLLESEQRRPISLELVPPRTSAEASFDSWDTSSVDAHNRQVVIEMSSSTTLKKALETIPASPSGTLTSTRPATPLGLDCLDPPQVLRRIESYSSSLHSQHEVNRLSPDSSVNELHIHPLFRSDSPTPPPAATPGTSVLAAPNAGQVISRRGSLQSLKRLRSGSLPVGRRPLPHHASLDNLKRTRTRDDGEVTHGDASMRSEKKVSPPVPEYRLSPTMKASLESFKEHRNKEDTGDAETKQ
ncbi:hypothetical protein EsDP_00001078 [Epichloe bromicola]|uniref:Uncharacterized protein n=1 Tax=Epichloe bromicola TaxID=79588 RepID=A0ABQ0CGS2_9HYPO